MAPRAEIAAYIRDLMELISVPSALGRQLLLLKYGLVMVQQGSANSVENALIRLVDRYPGIPPPSPQDLRVLIVYHAVTGGVHHIVGSGGKTIDQWATGVDHQHAAKLLGLRRPATAMRALRRAARRLSGMPGT